MLTLLPKFPRLVVKIVVGLWRRRWLVVAVSWLLAIAGWVAITMIPDMYESRAQVYINTDTALDETLSEVGNRPNFEKLVRVMRTQLLSRDNIEQVIYNTGLDANIRTPVELERLISDVTSMVSVETREDQYFIISYMDTSPEMAQRVVAEILDLFIEQSLTNAMDDVDRAMVTLDRELELRQRELNIIDQQIADFRRDNSDELAGSNRTGRRLESKDEELARVRDQISSVSLRQQRLISAAAVTPRFSPGTNVDELKLRLATLQSQFNDNYPDIRRLKAQIAELESGSSALPQNPQYAQIEIDLRAATDELASLQLRERRLQSEIDELTFDIAQTPDAEAELTSLMRDRDQIEATFTNLRAERASMDVSANLQRAGGAIEYRLFEAPKVAAEPSWPSRGLYSLAVLVLALGAGCGVGFVLTQIDRSYTQVADLEHSLGLPVLGSLSPAPSPLAWRKRLYERTAFLAIAGGLIVAAGSLFWVYEISVGSHEEPARTAQAQPVHDTGMR